MSIKTLRVCLSKDLPGSVDRDSNFIYFTYDDLKLYFGKIEVNENFAIATQVPESQIDGMIYILSSDGSVHRMIDYVDKVIAEIEDQSQIDILAKAGTMYYINNAHRYIDTQTRSMTLPFNDGNYELNVSMRNNQVFDENTIAKYNPEKGIFEIYGEDSDEFIDFSKPFRGGETATMNIIANGPRLQANVKISKTDGNLIRAASDGLFINSVNLISADQFNEFVEVCNDFRGYANDILDGVAAELESLQDLVTPETIRKDEYDILEARFENIQIAIDNYAEIRNKLEQLNSYLTEYTLTKVKDAQTALEEELEKNTNWEDEGEIPEDFETEIDYFAASKDYYYKDRPDPGPEPEDPDDGNDEPVVDPEIPPVVNPDDNGDDTLIDPDEETDQPIIDPDIIPGEGNEDDQPTESDEPDIPPVDTDGDNVESDDENDEPVVDPDQIPDDEEVDNTDDPSTDPDIETPDSDELEDDKSDIVLDNQEESTDITNEDNVDEEPNDTESDIDVDDSEDSEEPTEEEIDT